MNTNIDTPIPMNYDNYTRDLFIYELDNTKCQLAWTRKELELSKSITEADKQKWLLIPSLVSMLLLVLFLLSLLACSTLGAIYFYQNI